jgi:hypothetical protein
MRKEAIWAAAGAFSALLWFASINLVVHGHSHVLRDAAAVARAAGAGLRDAHHAEGRLLGDRNA